jgi:hypothetical protein
MLVFYNASMPSPRAGDVGTGRLPPGLAAPAIHRLAAIALQSGLQLPNGLIGLLDGLGAVAAEVAGCRTKLLAGFAKFADGGANVRMLLERGRGARHFGRAENAQSHQGDKRGKSSDVFLHIPSLSFPLLPEDDEFFNPHYAPKLRFANRLAAFC